MGLVYLIIGQSYDVRKYSSTLHYLIIIIMQTYLKVLNC